MKVNQMNLRGKNIVYGEIVSSFDLTKCKVRLPSNDVY